MSHVTNEINERKLNEHPVSAIAPQQLSVTTGSGTGLMPLFANSGWDAPASNIQRAVILIHGRMRNADDYFDLACQARTAAQLNAQDTLLIVPQFLASADVAAHHLPPSALHWDWTSWMGGEPALGPAPISSLEVLDAILDRLAQRERFPALRHVVVAGHSGGGQVVQRYAVVTRGEAPLIERGIALRYVVANPSSYVYFDEQRPSASGTFAPFDATHCADFNHWKYGLVNPPAYAKLGHDGISAATLEAAYARRDVITLLGGDDCDPLQPALDTSCAANAQGAHRLERGRAYSRYMRLRHADALRHRHFEIPGVGHNGSGIFTSAQGLAALFDIELNPGLMPQT